jgi:endothelin-converting enzyme
LLIAFYSFDTLGRHNDYQGNLVNWWKNETDAKFEEKAMCFEYLYGNITVPELFSIKNETVHINGHLTVGENIADNGGMKMAYHAYLEHVGPKRKILNKPNTLPGMEDFHPDVLFFLSFAQQWCNNMMPLLMMVLIDNDVHTLQKYRLVGTIKNSKEFMDTFNCKPQDRMGMRKGDMCDLW